MVFCLEYGEGERERDIRTEEGNKEERKEEEEKQVIND